MESIKVRDLGHLNQLTDDYFGAVEHMRRFYGARFFNPMWVPEMQTTNNLYVIGETCFEFFAPWGADSVLGRALRRRGPGFYAFELKVADYHQAKDAVRQRQITVVTDAEPDYFWMHPRDTHGLLIEICPHDFSFDPRAEPGWDTRDRSDGLLGISELAQITLTVRQAGPAADFLADLCGGDIVDAGDLPGVAGRSITVEIAGVHYRLLEPCGDGEVADQLAADGPSVRSVTFSVDDIDRLPAWSQATMMPLVAGDDPGSWAVPAPLNLGLRYEFVERGQS
jgi:hypothetical protein